MIDIGKILKRSWHILWNYKLLWIFGILLAITTGYGSGAGNSGTGYRYSGDTDLSNFDFQNYQYDQSWDELRDLLREYVFPLLEHPDQHVSTFLWIGVGLLLFILTIAILYAIVRNVSEAAIQRMVDGYEQDGQKVGFKAGWKLGWSRRAFRLWVLNLLISLPVILVVALLFALGIFLYVNLETGRHTLAIASLVALVGSAFVLILALSLFMVFLSLLRQFFARKIVLEDKRVVESIQQGWELFKHNWKSAAVMWLVMLGIGIGYGIAGIIIFFLLFPVYAILLLPALLAAAIPGLLIFGIANLFTHWILAVVIAGLVALPFFFIVLFSPLMLIGGWYRVFESSTWTLTYREVQAMESLQSSEKNDTPEAGQ